MKLNKKVTGHAPKTQGSAGDVHDTHDVQGGGHAWQQDGLWEGDKPAEAALAGKP